MRLHGCLLVVLPCMALDTSNRNEKRARTYEGVFNYGGENFWVLYLMCWKNVGRDF